jgi:hypothetical protein
MCNCEKHTKEEVKVNKPTLPICLEMENAKIELFKTIGLLADKYHLPFFLMESMFFDAAQRVSQLAEKERKAALENYNKQLEESGWE